MNKEIQYAKPSKVSRVFQVVRGVLSFAFVRRTGMLFAYYIVNYVNGYRLCQKGENINIHPTVILRHPENVLIGAGSFFNHNNVIQAGKKDAKIRVGENVMTGPNVMMFAYNHGMKRGGVPMIEQGYTEADIQIDDDVWVGAGSVILAGAHIGRGAVIAAGSVVRGEVDPYGIYAGQPAKKIKER